MEIIVLIVARNVWLCQPGAVMHGNATFRPAETCHGSSLLLQGACTEFFFLSAPTTKVVKTLLSYRLISMPGSAAGVSHAEFPLLSGLWGDLGLGGEQV